MQDPISTSIQYPSTFDGRFFFTNWTNEDFHTKWNKVEYMFPANKTSPLILSGETLEGTQNVRKIFAEQLAEREYYKSPELKKLENNTPVGEGSSLHGALSYAPLVKDRQTGEWDERSPLASLALKCLEPLPVENAKMSVVGKKEVVLKGKSKILNAEAHEDGSVTGESLIGNGQVIA